MSPTPPVSGGRFAVASLALVLGLANAVLCQQPSKRLDTFGDPLPQGALMRIGSTRLRHAGAVRALVFSPDSRVLASAGDDGTVRFWSMSDGKQVMRIEHDAAAIDWSPDGKTLASIFLDGTIHLWNVATGKRFEILRASDDMIPMRGWNMRFQADGKSLSIAAEDRIFTHQIATDKRTSLRVPLDETFRISLSPDGKQAAYRNKDHILQIWDVVTGKQLRKFPVRKPVSDDAVFSPDNRYLITSFSLWELATGRLIHTFSRPDQVFAFSPDGRSVASCDDNGRVRLWDPSTGKERKVLSHDIPFHALAFSPDSRLLATGGDGGAICIWDLATGQEKFSFSKSPGGAPAAFLHEGRRLAVSSTTGLIFYDLASPRHGAKAWTFRERRRLNGVNGLISPDGQTVAAADYDDVTVWDVVRQTQRRFRGTPFSGTRKVAYTPDSRTLALTDPEGVQLVDLETGQVSRKLPGASRPQGGTSLAFTPDGKTLITAVGWQNVELDFWDPIQLKKLRQMTIPTRREDIGINYSRSAAISFTPSGRYAILDMPLHGVELWDLTRAKKVADFDFSSPVAFSPDGRFLAATREFVTVQLWERASGKLVTELNSQGPPITSLLFAPDNQVLATGMSDETTLLWDVRVPRLFASVKPIDIQDDRSRNRCWESWAGTDAAAAYRDLTRLALDPAGSVAFLQARLSPVVAPPADRVQQWITQLDSVRFNVREKAYNELHRLGRVAEPALQATRKARPPLEVLRRIELLLTEMTHEDAEWGSLTGEKLHILRAIHLLEIVGTPQAHRLLERLAGGAALAMQTHHARAALLRLRNDPRDGSGPTLNQ